MLPLINTAGKAASSGPAGFIKETEKKKPFVGRAVGFATKWNKKSHKINISAKKNKGATRAKLIAVCVSVCVGGGWS